MIRKGMFISDRYEVIDKVGSGGMSDVYKAKDHKLGRFVAIKVLKVEFSDDTNFVSKFKVEAQSAAGLTHPNIVNVYDVGEDEGIYYIVMELIEGITLKKYIEKKGKLPAKEAVSIAIQVAQGIEAAHNNHIIHRDIKPQNIMISREGKVKVTDFGIARAASTHTVNGNAMGSVHYISPEQAKGGYIDEKSDVYSLGISLYEMITSEVPFEGDSTVSVALQHINEEMPNPRNKVADVPVSVEKIIAKCTQKKPERRYLKVSSLIADLKKSLITPDEDFVQLTPLAATGATVVINKDEISLLNEKAKEMETDEKMTGEESEEYKEELSDDDDLFENDDIDAVSPKFDRIITIASIVGAIVVGIAVILVAIQLFGGCDSSGTVDEPSSSIEEDETLSDKQTRVPKVVGMEEEEAINTLKEASLGFKIEKREPNNTVPKGSVISQSEKENEVVDKNSTIKLVISDGPQEITIPDVAGMTKEEAQKLLEGEKYGLVVSFEYQMSDEVEAEKVIETNPKASEKGLWGDEIKLIVSQGTDTSDVEVPDIKKMTQEAAKEKLAELGLTLKVQAEKHSDTVEKGKIINQTIAAGKSVPRGTEIEVTVSKGPEEVSTEEATTEEQTTESKTKLTQFRSISYSDIMAGEYKDVVNDIMSSLGEEGTAKITAEVEYTRVINDTTTETSTRTVKLESEVFDENWKQGVIYFEAEAKPESDTVLTYYLDGKVVAKIIATFPQ